MKTIRDLLLLFLVMHVSERNWRLFNGVAFSFRKNQLLWGPIVSLAGEAKNNTE